jgi:adenine phosphoribosyltransferase
MTEMSSAATMEELRRAVRDVVKVVPNFPSPGVNYRDMSATWEQQPRLFRLLVDEITRPFHESPPDVVLSIDSLGHVFKAPVAYILKSRLVLARSAGKLAGDTFGAPYTMSYSANRHLEIHSNAIRPNERVLIVDDVPASGGTVAAALVLVERTGARCVGIACAVEVIFPGTRSRLQRGDVRVHAVVQI